ncbi:MAG: hypothetical protein AB1898_17895 [Acidobacteriota bacterium]
MIRHLFTLGVFFMVGLIGFAGAYFARHLFPREIVISSLLVLVAVVMVKMLAVRDHLFAEEDEGF